MVTKRHLQRTQKFTNSSDSVIKFMGKFSKLSRVLIVTEEGKNPGGEIDPGVCVEQKRNVQRGTDGSALLYQNTNHKTASSEL